MILQVVQVAILFLTSRGGRKIGNYIGETYNIPLEQGGFCFNKNIDTIAPVDMVYPSKNIWLNEGGIRKRGGTAPIDTNIMYTIGTPVFDGSGLDDMSAGTVYTNTTTAVFTITLSATGTPDKFDWTCVTDDYVWEADNVNITGGAQTLYYGFKITFAATTGHTVGDKWTVTITAPEVTGLHEFTLINTNKFILRHTTDGKLWKNNADTIKTGWTANKIAQFIQYGDMVLVSNSANCPVTWNGSDASTTDITTIPTDWTGSNFPSQMIVHGRGNSVRTWALGCPLNPENIYVTTNGNLTDFTQATVLVFNIRTGSRYGIVGGIEYGNRLILFSKDRAFIMNDDDANTDNWGYSASQWQGGAASHRLIVKTPNDVVCMMDNGEIYSISAAEEYGDYKAASLTRPSFMHEWIKKYINLSKINDFHAIYDPVLRAVKFFMVRTGQTKIDCVMCYFIDRPSNKAWVILGNQVYESGYSARSSALVEVSAGSLKIYTGSYNGKVWKLGETNRNDNGNAFISIYKTPLLSFDNVREHKRYDRMKIVSISEGACAATFTWWIDGSLKNSKDIEFSASGDVLGSFILGTSVLGGLNILESSISLGYIGKRIQIEAKSNTANEDFFLSQFLVDFVPLQKRI